MGGYYFGYYIGIFNPLGEPLAEKVYGYSGEKKISLIGNINLYFTVGAAVSVFLCSHISDIFGRVRLVIFLELLALFTCYTYTIQNITVLLITRTVCGVIVGLNSTILPVALTEMFPGSVRGFGGFVGYFAVSSFILLGWFANPLCGSEDNIENRTKCLSNNWKVLLSWPAVVGVIRILLLIYSFKFGILESPGFYLNKFKGIELEKALNGWFSTVYSSEYVQIKTEQVIKDSEEIKRKAKPTLSSMFSKIYGFRFFVVCMLNILQQFSGINFLIFFSTTLFDQLSGNGSTMSLLIGAANVSGALVGMYSIGKYGRRFNMVMGCLIQAFSFATLGMGKKNN